MARKTPLAKLCDAGPFRDAWIAIQLGYTNVGSWYLVRSGRRRLPDAKAKLLAAILNVPLVDIQKAAKRTYKGD